MKTQTKYFGELEYAQEDVLSFPAGLYGFEDEKEFLLIPFEGSSLLYSLQSVKTPMLSFILVHPFSLDPAYAPVLQPEELKMLNVEQSEQLCYYVLCALKKPSSESTVNMRCPVAVNPDARTAMQVVLEDDRWLMRQRLAEFETPEGEASPC